MQELFVAIWHQDMDTLIASQHLGLMAAILFIILFLESGFVFLPLPGDSLVLLAGGMLGMGIVGPEVALFYLPLAAGLGSLVAYAQGRKFAKTRLMGLVERILPSDSLSKATKMLASYGILAMFGSRFIPFVRVLTPMLMGASRLSFIRVGFASFASAFLWALLLGVCGMLMVSMPFYAKHQALITQLFLSLSLTLFVFAVAAIGFRLRKNKTLAAKL